VGICFRFRFEFKFNVTGEVGRDVGGVSAEVEFDGIDNMYSDRIDRGRETISATLGQCTRFPRIKGAGVWVGDGYARLIF
jgi:hypothetical protein